MITGINFEFCRVASSIYTISDSDFETILVETKMIAGTDNPYVYECIQIIISIYEEKQLNVSANIVHWLYNIYPSNNTSFYLEKCKINVPKYNKYADDVEKYLLLM